MEKLERAADLAQQPAVPDGKNPFPSKSRRRGSAEADLYKAKCSDLERAIVQLKLELAEAKVRTFSVVVEIICATSAISRIFLAYS